MNPSNLHLHIEAVAPDYDVTVITIQDQFEFESKWLIKTGPITPEDLEALNLLHVHFSQGRTGRN